MPYRNAKIYSDGSHYIAIPQTTNPQRRKKSPERIVCAGTEMQTTTDKTGRKTAEKTLTPKERFERIYRENNGKRKAEKIEILTEELKRDFETEEQAQHDRPQDKTCKKDKPERMELVLHIYLRKRQAYGGKFQERLKRHAETNGVQKRLEVYLRMGTRRRNKQTALSRRILYPGKRHAGKTRGTQ